MSSHLEVDAEGAGIQIGRRSLVDLGSVAAVVLAAGGAVLWAHNLQAQVSTIGKQMETMIDEVKRRPTREEIELQWDRLKAQNNNLTVPKPWRPGD